MSITIIIGANVKDFENGLPSFNELEDQRQEVGINFSAFKNTSEPHKSFAIWTKPSKQVLFDFQTRSAIQGSLIVKQPIITFLEGV